LYPKKEKKKPRRILEKTVLLATDGEGLYIRKRPKTGLLAGLWEFPSLDGVLSMAQATECARAMGIEAEGAIEAVEGKHIFTHLEWHMRGYLLSAKNAGRGFVLATPRELKEVYPIASAFRVFLDFIAEKEK
jgi:A/G-specific adenine glycosylase